MYLKYYRLRESPFAIAPDPAYLFLGATHKEALASILYGIEDRKGFIAVTGEVGTGKTILLKALLEKIDPCRVETAYLFNPELSFPGLVHNLFHELCLGAPGNSLDEAVRRLHQHLIESYREGKHVVLLIDEAQRMPPETLERLRILSNLETTKHKLLQIVLCGQPELLDTLARDDLRQLRQRVAVEVRLLPLTPKEGVDYMQHRLKRVGYSNTPVFTGAAMKRIVRYARGNPRVLHIAAEHTLIAGYADQVRPITAKLVKSATADLRLTRKPRPRRWLAAVAAACVLIAFTGAALSGRVLNLAHIWPSPVSLAIVKEPPREDNPMALTATNHALPDESADKSPLRLKLDTQSIREQLRRIAATQKAPSRIQTSPLTRAAETGTHTGGEETPDNAQEDDPGVPVRNAVSHNKQAHEAPAKERTTVCIIKPGDTLIRLITQTYGETNDNLVQLTLRNNPHISDADSIRVGDTVVFPHPVHSASSRTRAEDQESPTGAAS